MALGAIFAKIGSVAAKIKAGKVFSKVSGALGSGSGGIFQRIKTKIQENRLAKGKKLLLPPSPALAQATQMNTISDQNAMYTKTANSIQPNNDENFFQKNKKMILIAGGVVVAGLTTLFVVRSRNNNGRKRRR